MRLACAESRVEAAADRLFRNALDAETGAQAGDARACLERASAFPRTAGRRAGRPCLARAHGRVRLRSCVSKSGSELRAIFIKLEPRLAQDGMVWIGGAKK